MMNWGKSIALVIVLFMGFIVSMGVLMMRSNEGLDDANYYEKGLDHDKKMERMNNSSSLEQPVRFAYNTGQQQLEVRFPEMAVGANVLLKIFRPDDAKQDKTLRFQIKDSASCLQVLNFSELNRGMWQIRMNWEQGSENYYDEYSFFKD